MSTEKLIPFDPDTFDMDAEIERVRLKWVEPTYNGAELYEWQQELINNPEAMQAKCEEWRRYKTDQLNQFRKNLAIRQWLEAAYNYRFPVATELFDLTWTPEVAFRHNYELPCLLLGVPAKDQWGHDQAPFEFLPDCPYDPAVYSNQSGGFACNHPSLHGVILPLSDKGFRAASTISKIWLDSQCQPRSPLNVLKEYQESLLSWGLDCNNCYLDFQEAWYPVDLDGLSVLTDIDVGKYFEDWVTSTIAKNQSGSFTFAPEWTFPRDWRLVICGDNSD